MNTPSISVRLPLTKPNARYSTTLSDRGGTAPPDEPQGSELARCDERFVADSVVQRLDADLIPHREKLALLIVPEDEREHPAKTLERLSASVADQRVEHDFCVGVRSKRTP